MIPAVIPGLSIPDTRTRTVDSMALRLRATPWTERIHRGSYDPATVRYRAMTTAQETTQPTNPHRLPRSVVPNRYEIELTPDLVNFVFAGHENVTVQVVEPVREFTLNAVDLEITSATLRTTEGSGPH